jgi:hypothetical protein
MYIRVLQDELQFPDDRAIDQDTKSLIRGVSSFCLFSFIFIFSISDALYLIAPTTGTLSADM